MSDIQRNLEGQFQPGQSGNPSGRPKVDQTIRDMAREKTETAIRTLVEVMEDPKAPKSARIQAAIALLDRGWGKPTQYNENEVRVGTPSNFDISVSDEALEDRIQLLVASRQLEGADFLN